MTFGLEVAGVEELRRAIAAAGPDFARTVLAPLVHRAGMTLASDVRLSYPVVTGNLRGGVNVATGTVSELRVGVRSNARHAWMYEKGTVRRYHGRGKYVGVGPPAAPGTAFIPKAMAARAQLYRDAESALARFRIDGMTGSAVAA